jgi:hypothetical protein
MHAQQQLAAWPSSPPSALRMLYGSPNSETLLHSRCTVEPAASTALCGTHAVLVVPELLCPHSTDRLHTTSRHTYSACLTKLSFQCSRPAEVYPHSSIISSFAHIHPHQCMPSLGTVLNCGDRSRHSTSSAAQRRWPDRRSAYSYIHSTCNSNQVRRPWQNSRLVKRRLRLLLTAARKGGATKCGAPPDVKTHSLPESTNAVPSQYANTCSRSKLHRCRLNREARGRPGHPSSAAEQQPPPCS